MSSTASRKPPFGATTLKHYAKHIAAAKIAYAELYGEQQAEILDLLMNLKVPQEH